MLNTSNNILFNTLFEFINNSNNVFLYSAYIKLDVIKKLNEKKKINLILVRWEIADLVNEVSDLYLYNYCKEYDIKLFRNTRLHLKAVFNDSNEIIFGSSNYTNNGLALSQNYNFELNSELQNLSTSDLIYLNKILRNSEYIDDIKFETIKNEVKKYEEYRLKIKELPTIKTRVDNYLISMLPMSKSFHDLYNFYKNNISSSIENKNCFIHDIVLFEIETNDLSYELFLELLKFKFNNNEFVNKLKDFIKIQPGKSLRYGGVIDWLQNNTTTVPTPLSWEFKKKEIVNILYYWIITFDDHYTTSIPGQKSEVIFYKQ